MNIEVLKQEVESQREENIKLTYTAEMQEQDELWSSEKEDLNLMKGLFKQVMDEAVLYGYSGCYDIYDASSESICEIFENEKDRAESYEYGESLIFGFCKPLIEYLEKYCLND